MASSEVWRFSVPRGNWSWVFVEVGVSVVDLGVVATVGRRSEFVFFAAQGEMIGWNNSDHDQIFFCVAKWTTVRLAQMVGRLATIRQFPGNIISGTVDTS